MCIAVFLLAVHFEKKAQLLAEAVPVNGKIDHPFDRVDGDRDCVGLPVAKKKRTRITLAVEQSAVAYGWMIKKEGFGLTLGFGFG